MFRTVPLSIIRNFSLYTQQWYMSYSLRAGSGRNVLILLASCMTYTIAVCTVKNSWWWTEELSETCRVLFQNKISASGWLYYKNLSRCTVVWTSKSVTYVCAKFAENWGDISLLSQSYILTPLIIFSGFLVNFRCVAYTDIRHCHSLTFVSTALI